MKKVNIFLVLISLSSISSSAIAQSEEDYLAFRIPSKPITSCAVIDKEELLTKGIGFRFDLEGDGSNLVGERTVDAEFDSTGTPLALVIVGADTGGGDGASPRFMILRFAPTGNISFLDLRKKQTLRRETQTVTTDSAEPAPGSLLPDAALRAKKLADWLWSKRCP